VCPHSSEHVVPVVLIIFFASPATVDATRTTRRRRGAIAGRRAEADVLDGGDGVEEHAAVELLHQRPVQQLAPHVHHRPVPAAHSPGTVILVIAPPRPAGVRRHAALPLVW
jgi:hypothetical protein